MSYGTTVTAEDIFTAAKLGNIENLDTASINCTNWIGQTALMLAAEAENLLALTRLLKAGADPNVHKRLRFDCPWTGVPIIRVTALTLAMKNFDIECVKELIRAGSFFDCYRGLDALEMAKDYQFMAAIAEGEKVMKQYLKDDSDQPGTAFYVAFINRRIDLLQDLIDGGVPFNLKSLACVAATQKEALINMLPLSPQNNPRGIVENLEALLTQAVQLQEISIVKILIKKYSDLDIVNFLKNKALQVACSNDSVELINALLVGAKMQEFSCSYIEIVQLLVSSGAEVNLVDKDGSTLLIKAVQSKQMEIVNFLLEKKVNIDQVDDSQSTALHYACMSNSLEIVKLLVNAVAKVEVYNKESLTPFSIACKISNIDMMKLLINAGSDINCVDTYERTPLINSIREENQQDSLNNLIGCFHYSAPTVPTTESHFDLTQFLQEHEAYYSNVDKDEMTALTWAAKTYNEQVFDLLIELKPEVNCVDLQQMTALAYAVMSRNVQMVAKLIQAGADVNIATNCQVDIHKDSFIACSNEHGRTPLHIAAAKSYLEILQSLCRFGANINAVDNCGSSPLFRALMFKNKDASKYLLECGADVNLTCDSLCSPLFVAVLYNDTELVKLLIQHGAILDMDEYSKLMVALEHRNVDVTIALLENGADANTRDIKKTPALTIAIKQYIGRYKFATPVLKATYEYQPLGTTKTDDQPVGTTTTDDKKNLWRNEIKLVAESFLNNGANISATDDEGNTCLHIAAEVCCVDVLELFVAHKADVNVQNAKGETPLMMACRHCGDVEAVSYLLSVGANVMLSDENNDTALHHTIFKGYAMRGLRNVISDTLPCIITLLIENNANIHARNGQEHGADISKVNKDGMTALMWAAKTNNGNVLKLLLDLKPEVNCVDLQQTTAFAHAVMSRNVQMLANLIQAGADVNIASNCQVECNAICILFYKHKELTKYLLECGADVNLICDSLCSPLFVAVLYNDTELVKLLIQHGAVVDKGKDSELMVALGYGNIEMAIAILEIGANPNLRDKNNTPALMICMKLASHINDYIVSTPSRTLSYYDKIKVWENKIKHLTQSFLRNGANVSATDDEGNTCLHLAVEICKQGFFVAVCSPQSGC
ncbi:serine/threonine-protein phosphatase 6 regulatory ankyrin repeat subunit A-like [Physella acuta]|uniref:serine/threonine-protein phosphatase 6 regulatory ankyrin repeat subunit A-like n=1 Tax=Physella acuta TaxID=109671 RepID=UPI0027DD85EA|nr:serine/threonine-protein phosphatase 6 regulatory ankyrin repeat subunit A-like [Physella acuta]